MWTALTVDKAGAFNVVWADTNVNDGWQGPLAVTHPNLRPGGAITPFFQQSPDVWAALTVDKTGAMDVVWANFNARFKKTFAVIVCRYQGEPANPATAQLFRQLFTPGTDGMLEYWRDVSMGAVDVEGSRVFEVELDIRRQDGNVPRSVSIDAAIRAVRRDKQDPTTGYHSQVAVLPYNWSNPAVPAGTLQSDPKWGQFWIDGSADGFIGGRICLPPPHNGNVLAHEMGHTFGMDHDLDATFQIGYADPCCIMSQNGALVHPTFNVDFGPAVCLPHMLQLGWLDPRRVYYDAGDWMARPDGITLPLAPICRPGAEANLGIKLAFTRGEDSWDYFLEYVIPTDWNRGVAGAPYLFIRRMAPDRPGQIAVPAYLGAIQLATNDEFVEPRGNVRFRAQRTRLPGPILRVTATKL